MPVATSPLQQAVQQHQSGQLAEAESLYQQVLQEDPENPDALNLLGVLCSQMDRFEEAMDHFHRAIRIRSDHAPTHQNLATAYRNRNQLYDAVEEYQKALAIAPEYASAHLDLGITLWQLGQLDAAETSLVNALSVDPTLTDVHRHLAQLKTELEEYEEAIEHWNAVINDQPDRIEDQIDLGILLHRTGQYEQAIKRFQSVTQEHPEVAGAWFNLGISYRALDLREKAFNAWQRSVQMDPMLEIGWFHLAQEQLERSDLRGTITSCLSALRIRPHQTTAHRLAARAMVLAGELERAEIHLTVAQQIDPESPSIIIELGDICRRRNRCEQAEEYFEKAIRINPTLSQAYAGQMNLHIQTGDVDRARQIADKAIKQFPDDVSIVAISAAVHIADRQYQTAQAILRKRLSQDDLSPTDRCRLLFHLGHVLDQLASYEEAWSVYEQANQLKGAKFDRNAFDRRNNHIMRIFNKQNMRSLPRVESTDLQPIFFAAVPRSGTTLLEQILSGHPQVAGAGEISLMERTVQHLTTLTHHLETYPRNIPQLLPGDIQALSAYANNELQEWAGSCPIVTEKSLTNFLFLGLVDMLFPQARIIMCRRDPLDTCLSYYFHNFTSYHPHAYDLDDLGYYYLQYERLLQHWQKVSSLPILDVEYEKLVAEPESEIQRVLDFCQLPWDDACLDVQHKQRMVQTASTQHVRQRINQSAVGRHRHYDAHLDPLRKALSRKLVQEFDSSSAP